MGVRGLASDATDRWTLARVYEGDDSVDAGLTVSFGTWPKLITDLRNRSWSPSTAGSPGCGWSPSPRSTRTPCAGLVVMRRRRHSHQTIGWASDLIGAIDI